MPAQVELELVAGQELDAQVIEVRPGSAFTTRRDSDDLGLRFFVGVAAPSDAELAEAERDPFAAARHRKNPNAGLWIAGVDPKGPAARAGLRRGDRVVSVGFEKAERGASATFLMMSLSQPWRSKGRSVVWVVERDGRELRLGVVVTEVD